VFSAGAFPHLCPDPQITHMDHCAALCVERSGISSECPKMRSLAPNSDAAQGAHSHGASVSSCTVGWHASCGQESHGISEMGAGHPRPLGSS